MEAAIIAGLFNIGGILLTYLLTKKDTLKKLDKKMDVYHAELKNSVNVKNNTLSAEHAGLSKEHTGLKEQINMLLWKNSFRRHKQGSTIFTMSRFGWKVCGRM